MSLRNVAVVLAGGTGTRVGLSIPKQLIKVAGKPIIEHTIAAFEQSELIDEIVVMMAPGYLDEVRAIVRNGPYTKVSMIIEGAEHPQRHHGGRARGPRRGGVQRLVARRGPAAGVADDPGGQRCRAGDLRGRRHRHPVRRHGDRSRPETASDAPVMTGVLPRHLLRRGQTPQSFRLSTIRAAYELAAQDPNFTATDDCTVVLRYLPEVPIAVVPGHERNMKVTEPDRRLHRRQVVPADLGRPSSGVVGF